MKHINQLKPHQRAAADQSIRDALLAIVVAQGKPVVIPIDQLNEIAEHNRLLIEVDHKAGVVKLTAQTHAAEIIETGKPKLIAKAASVGKTIS